MARITKKPAIECAREDAAKLGVPVRMKPGRKRSGEVVARPGR
jgi:hypothetical protein